MIIIIFHFEIFKITIRDQISSKSFTELVLKMTVIDGGRPKARQTLGHILFPLAALPAEDEGQGEAHLYKLDLEKVFLIESIKAPRIHK
jgi:hypothetical protein